MTLHSGSAGEVVRVVHRRPDEYTVSLDEGFGHVLRVLPDVDGDGRGDLWVSARHDGALGAGVGQVHSAATGERLARFQEQADPRFRVDAWPFGFGCAVDVLGDLDGDGVSDFAASLHNVYALRAVEGEVWICSGRDGSRLATLTAAVVEAWPRGFEGAEGEGSESGD